MREFIRWVQFRYDDPLVAEYEAKGYPVKKLQTYSGTTVVGFPTQPEICRLGMGDKLVTAPEATPAEQFQWLRLLEKYWIRGVEVDGVTPPPESGNQISFTVKYPQSEVTATEYHKLMVQGVFGVRCVSVLPLGDTSAYEYLPEEACTKAHFEQVVNAIIASDSKEDVGFEHVDCAGGVCPVDFQDGKL